MSQVEAQSRDHLWVLLKLERMKAHTLDSGLEDEPTEFRSTSVGGWRLTVRADDKIDPTSLISLFRREIERASGVVPAAMQPFYVYGVVVFEWHEKLVFSDESLLLALKDLVARSDLKRSPASRQ